MKLLTKIAGTTFGTLVWWTATCVSGQIDYSVLRGFGFGDQSGYHPYSALIEGTNGALYGTTSYGGYFAAGTLFRVQKDGTGYIVLHHFGSSEVDGKQPMGA